MKSTPVIAAALLCGCTFLIPLRAEDPSAGPGACDTNNQSGDYLKVINTYLAGESVSRWIDADCRLIGPIWTGDDNKGQLYSPLWRGAGGAIEDWIPPGATFSKDSKGTVRIDWDKTANTVHFTIKLYRAPVSPRITRVDGGDPEISNPADPRHYVPPPQASWWYNKFHTNPKDMPVKASNGTAYRLWTFSRAWLRASIREEAPLPSLK